MDEAYVQHHNAALWLAQQNTAEPGPKTKFEPIDDDINSYTTKSQPKGLVKHPTNTYLALVTPFHVPMEDDLKSRIAFQQMRNEDLATRRSSAYDDQGIIFRNQCPVDVMKEQYLQSTSQAPAPEEPDSDDDGDDDDCHCSPRHPNDVPRGDPSRPPRGNPGGGGSGGPPDGSNGPTNNSDRGNPHNWSNPPYQGYTMPPAGHAKPWTPGVQAVIEHHHGQMHSRLV
jgi:hypothetical protein